MYISRLAISTLAVVASLAAASPATAASSDWPAPGSQPADVILMTLERQGYRAGINWVNNGRGVPLSRCQVSGYHAAGDTPGADPASVSLYVDVVCHDED